MPSAEQTAAFIKSSFRSAWMLELMCYLMNDRGRAHAHREMVEELRASDLIVKQGIMSLSAIGLLQLEEDGAARYAPLNAELDGLAEAARALYATSPDAVRRMIVSTANPSLTAFSNAFKLWED